MLSKLNFNQHRNTLNIRYSVAVHSKKLNPLIVISHVWELLQEPANSIVLVKNLYPNQWECSYPISCDGNFWRKQSYTTKSNPNCRPVCWNHKSPNKAALTKMSGSGHTADSPLKVKKVWIWRSGGPHFCYLVCHFESSPGPAKTFFRWITKLHS